MSTIKAVLFDTQFAPAADTSMFASDAVGSGTIIDKFTATNTDSSNHAISVRLVPPSETPTGTDFTVVVEKVLAAGQTYLFPEIVGQMLAPGGAIWMQADAANVLVVRANGRNDTSTS